MASPLSQNHLFTDKVIMYDEYFYNFLKIFKSRECCKRVLVRMRTSTFYLVH